MTRKLSVSCAFSCTTSVDKERAKLKIARNFLKLQQVKQNIAKNF
jgi:hypothetical protein